MARAPATTRIGGHVVAESLRVLGAEVVFGVPGVHALPIWEGLRATDLRLVGFRQELNAAFAADGRARVTGRPAAVLVSTGPGAFMTLAPVMEASMAFVPLVVVSSQIATNAIGKGHGHLHESPDQAASFAPLVKWVARAGSPAEIPDVLAEAWRRAAMPPPGPVYVEVPSDVLRAPVEAGLPELDGTPLQLPLPDRAQLDRAAALLAAAERPLVIAGGGAVRSEATPELLELATRLGAPVATTHTGKGAFPERHPLALGSAWDEVGHKEIVADADVVLAVGSRFGWDVTDYFRLELRGTLVQIDAAPERIGINFPALGLVGDAKATLAALLDRIEPGPRRDGKQRVAAIRQRIERGLAGDPNRRALELLGTVEEVLPEVAAAAWDSTILAYAACSYLRVADPRWFLYPSGSSTLGYALPAALGAATALPGAPLLAIAGDGGVQYGLAELATARQHGLDVALLVIDDHGYGILREYQDAAGFSPSGVDLEHPDFLALFEAYGIPARQSTGDALGGDLRWALELPGPAAVMLEEVLELPTTHG